MYLNYFSVNKNNRVIFHVKDKWNLKEPGLPSLGEGKVLAFSSGI